jgi:hypothetical protein
MLPRNPMHWPNEARHQVEERIGMSSGGRPLTASEEADLRTWAEECVRVVWRVQGGAL